MDTTSNTPSSPNPLDGFRAQLEGIEPDRFTPIGEPLGWRCSCGGRMTSTTNPADAPIADVIASLVDAARSHATSCAE